MNIPVISVIIPTYNRKELLEKAILSVIQQKKDVPFAWELIIVDDGGSDGTAAFIEQYIKEFPEHITYIYNTHSGIPGVGRNIGLERLRKDSTYTIFLDDDDEFVLDLFSVCLKKREQLKKMGTYDTILGFYFLCENERGEIIGERPIGDNGVILTYKTYLSGKINNEFMLVLKSNIFTNNLQFRFSEEVITEGVLWSKIWKYTNEIGVNLMLYNYVGRIYGTLGLIGQKKITKTIHTKRFLRNAKGNELLLEVIGDDLLYYGFKKQYGEFLFKIGINYVLYGERKKGLKILRKSLCFKKSIINFGIYICSIIHRRIVLFLYTLYI